MLITSPGEGSNIPGLKDIVFKLGMNGTSDPSILEGNGLSAAPAYSATGIWTGVLKDAPDGEYKGARINMSCAAAPVDLKAQLVSYTASTKTFVIKFSKASDNSAVAPPAANANSWLLVELLFGSPAG